MEDSNQAIPCLSDADLLSLLQTLPSDWGEVPWAAHFEQCESCRERADQLFVNSRAVEFRDSFHVERQVPAHKKYVGPEGTSDGLSPTPTPTHRIGPLAQRFEVLAQLGVGGSAVVFRARDRVLNREVALKLPHAARLLDPEFRLRFLREAQFTATLHHPHIVQVYDAGELAGECYLVSEFCPGETVASWMSSQAPTPPRDAARLVLCLADALAHAHSRQIVHRDIKPSNVILDSRSAVEGLPFCPMLTDFGMAKLMDAALPHTGSGHAIGTPRYMSPEQAAGRTEDIGPASDIYALGILLYELVTGVPVVDGGNNADTLLRVVSDTPVLPRRLRPSLHRDLDAIIVRCLEKEPSRRYETAGQLADDLRKYLTGLPTRARPLSVWTRTWRWAKRNSLAAVWIFSTVLIGLVIIVGLSFHTSQLADLNFRLDDAAKEAEEARHLALRREHEARTLLYASDMRLSSQSLIEGDVLEAGRLVARHSPENEPEFRRGSEWHFLNRCVSPPRTLIDATEDSLYVCAISPDARLIATAGRESVIRLYERLSGRLRQSIETEQEEINSVAFAPDGSCLVSAGDDGTLCYWELPSGTLLTRVSAHDGLVFDVDFAPDGTWVASGGEDGLVKVWDFRSSDVRRVFSDNRGPVEALAISPDGQWLASAGEDSTARVWNLITHEQEHVFEVADIVETVAFSRDSALLAAGTTRGSRNLHVWSIPDGVLRFEAACQDGVCAVAFSPGDSKLAAIDARGTARLWDAARILGDLSSESDPEFMWQTGRTKAALAFDTDGEVVTAGRDGATTTWHLSSPVRSMPVPHPTFDVQWYSDTELVIVNSRAIEIMAAPTRSSDFELREEFGAGQGPWTVVDVSSDRRVIAAGSGNIDKPGRIVVWYPAEGRSQVLLDSEAPREFVNLVLSSDGRYLAATWRTFDGGIPSKGEKFFTLYDVAGGRVIRELAASIATQAVFTPDERELIFSLRSDVHTYDLHSGTTELLAGAHAATINDIAVSPSGKWLATEDGLREIRIWNRENLKQPHAVLRGHRRECSGLAFARDEQTIFAVSHDGTLRGWHVETGQSLGILQVEDRPLKRLQISEEGKLVTIKDQQRLMMFDFSPSSRRPLRIESSAGD